MRLALLFLLLAAVLFVLLATQDANYANWIPLELPFTDQSISSPLLGWIGGSFGIGLLLGYLAAVPGRFGAASRAKKAEKQLAEVEAARAEAAAARAEAATARHPVAPPVAPAAPVVQTAPARPAVSEADEMQRLADEVARRTDAVKRDDPGVI